MLRYHFFSRNKVNQYTKPYCETTDIKQIEAEDVTDLPDGNSSVKHFSQNRRAIESESKLNCDSNKTTCWKNTKGCKAVHKCLSNKVLNRSLLCIKHTQAV